jgi:arabinofuranan 3-O-arabinosyltransferase
MTFAQATGQYRPPRTQGSLTGIVDGTHPRAAPIRRWGIAVWLVAFLILVLNDRGHIFFDTKLGVDLDPIGFYARLWHLWNPTEWFGTLQDQYIGYAFPMAPFYAAGQLLKVPVWLTERLWLSFLVAVGFAGLVKLAQAARIGTDRSRVVAGLAFALWPTFTMVIGSTSAGILPGVLAPWAVLPLISAANGDSLARAAARSGVAVLFMGGVNATSTLYGLILPAAYIVTQLRGRRRVRLAALWLAAAALATSWWLVPLLLQAKYSYNFLPYVEQAATTTGTMSAAAFLRGAGNWTAYLNLGQPWLRAGWVMVAYPVAIMAAAIAAATGLLGLSRKDLPGSAWLRLSLGIAALIALCGYPGPLGGMFHQSVGQLLDGVAAPLRSVYKVEPVAAAVLSLGIAHALVLRTRSVTLAADPAPRTLWHLFAAPVIGLVLLGLAWPQVSGQVLNSGPFTAIPAYWYQAAAFLKQHSPRAPALVVPAAAHGVFVWGEPVDDPLEPLASSPWVAQGLVPYGGAGSEVLLRSVEAAINSGERIAGLAATLSRSGIRYVVVRNDLSPFALGYIPPQVVHQALVSSGFRVVATFGQAITRAQATPGAPQTVLPSYPAVEIFAAGPARAGPPRAAVALPISKTVLVNGGPDALLQLTAQRILSPSTPAVIAGDKLPVRPALWAVTDSLRRADNTFGLIDPTASYTYTASETNPVDDPLGNPGGAPRQMLPVPGAGHQTVAVLTGAASVTASSSGSWLSETPQIDPVNAFDGDPHTAWVEANPTTAVGQWVQITFNHRLVLPASINITLLDDVSSRPVPIRLTIRTDAGVVTSRMQRTHAAQPLRVPPGPTRTLRITIAGVSGGVPGGPGAGFADVSIPGVVVTRYLKTAQDPAGEAARTTAFSFQRQVASPASLANVAAYPPLARTFATAAAGTFTLRASAIAVPGPALDAILTSLTPVSSDTLEVTASSTYGSLPGLAPANLFRRDHPGPWIAGGQHAALRLSWLSKRTIRRMVIQPLPGLAAAPESIKITSPQGIRYASVGLGGLTEIVPPLTTNQMTITFPVIQYATSAQPVSGQPVRLPVGMSSVSVPALAGLRPATLAPHSTFALPCGSGPLVTLDGRSLRTRVFGNAGSLVGFQPVHVRLCGPSGHVQLAGGRHWLAATKQDAFTITGLSLVSSQAAAQAQAAAAGPAAAGGAGRRATVLAWSPEQRQVRVAPGAACYLELHQNANPGWSASLHGKVLTPVRLDGWQQAFIIPAGSGGVVTLTFKPVKFYHVWIVLSAAGVLALLLAAIAWRRRGRLRAYMDPSSPAGFGPAGLGPAIVSQRSFTSYGVNPVSRQQIDPMRPSWGPAGRGPDSWRPAGLISGSGEATSPFLRLPEFAPAGRGISARRPTSTAGVTGARLWLSLIALAGLLAIVGGPMVLAVPVVAMIAYWWPGWRGWIAAMSMIAAGVLTALAAHPAQPGSGAFGSPAQACALVALTCALMPRLPAREVGRS